MDCPECGKSVQDRDTLDQHLELHSSGEGVECQECGWLYGSERALKCHHTKKHGKDPEWTTYDCERCGVEVGHYSGADDRASRFCRSCYEERRSADEIEVECEICGCVEVVPEYLSERRFCSSQCRADWVSENVRGAAHPNWKGGTEQYRGPNWDTQREKALERDQSECRICRDDEDLIVHHIVSYHEFTDPSEANRLKNLATLCRSCHGYLEGWISRKDMDASAQEQAFKIAQNRGHTRIVGGQ